MRKKMFGLPRLLIISVFGIFFAKAQNLNKLQTIEYISGNSNYKVFADSAGNITIDDKVKFNYSNITINKFKESDRVSLQDREGQLHHCKTRR